MEIEFGCATSFLDQVSKVGTKVGLLAQENGIEIIYQSIAANRPFTLKPGNVENLFEFIYVLDGEFKQTDDSRLFKSGDYIVARGLDHNIYFHTLTEVSLLYIANNTVFNDQKQNINRLNDLLNPQNQSTLSNEVETAVNVGVELELDSSQIYHLAYAVALHDSSDLSHEPSRNSEHENDLKVLGQNLDDNAFQKVADIIIQHHERFDGTGNPYGLKGDEILVESQILAVVDLYGRLITGRSELSKHDPISAIKYIESEVGLRFSPRVVQAFKKIKNFSE